MLLNLDFGIGILRLKLECISGLLMSSFPVSSAKLKNPPLKIGFFSKIVTAVNLDRAFVPRELRTVGLGWQGPARANEEILHGKHSADERNVQIDPHLKSFHEPATRLIVMPAVRRGEEPVDAKELLEILQESAERLDVIVGPI